MTPPLPADDGLARRRLWLWTATLALVVRLVYFFEHSGSAFFGVPILDEAYYDSVARALLAGEDVSAINPAFRPLLYPALLSAVYGLSGGWDFVAALALQHLLGVVVAVLVAELGRRLFGSVLAGACAGALYALAGPPLYFESQLLNTALFTFLVTVFLALPVASKPSGGRSVALWAAAGIVLGLAAQARPNALTVLAAVPILLLWNPWKARIPERLAALAAFGAAVLGVLLGAAFLHAPSFGAFHLLPTSGGVNFYLGNKDGADGMIPRQDQHASYGDRYRDSVQLFSERVYGEKTGAEPPYDPRDVSRFWYAEALHEALGDPLRSIGLLGRKALLLSWNHEIPNNKSFHFFAREESRLLGLLPVRWALLLGLAVAGSWAAWRRDPARTGWILLFVGCYALGPLLFFVNARYRVPLWPALAVLAGGGLAAGLRAAARRFGRGDGGPAVPVVAWILAAILVAASAVNWLGVEPESPYRDYFFRSLAYQHKGQIDEARADARRAVELAPEDAAAHFQLGTLALLQEDLETAERHLSVATRLLPTEPRVLNNLGIVLERRKEYSSAFLAYARAVEVGPDFSAAWVNLALLELRAGEVERAAEKIHHAEQLGDRSVPLQCARAFLEIKRGNLDVGKAILAGAMKRDQELTQRLVDEHRRPLTLERRRRPKS